MTKEERIKAFEKNHKKLRNVISKLTEEQMVSVKVAGDWSVKDILAHLTAWNLRGVEEIEAVLNCDTSWIGLSDKEVDDFNQKGVEERKNLSVKQIINYWEKSYQKLIDRIKILTEEEFSRRSGRDPWKNGEAMTVESLFDYRYEGDGHEGGHANQIKKSFGI